MSVRVAVLASGTGTNLQALIDFLRQLGDAAAARLVLVASNRRDCIALDRARSASIAAESFNTSDDGSELLGLLTHNSIELLVLAGYLKRIPPPVIEAYRGRIINVHPALLPDFGGAGMYGPRVHSAVIASGVRASGVTVHFVDDEFDHGPIIAQWRVPIRDEETAESLATRILQVEHIVYPRVVEMVASLASNAISADF